jgi:hypothetical protein
MKLLETPMRNLREKEQMSFHRVEAEVRMQGIDERQLNLRPSRCRHREPTGETGGNFTLDDGSTRLALGLRLRLGREGRPGLGLNRGAGMRRPWRARRGWPRRRPAWPALAAGPRWALAGLAGWAEAGAGLAYGLGLDRVG